MSLFQFNAAVAGWNVAQGGGQPAAPSDDVFDAMVERSAAERAKVLH